ncbi:hypothetical protein BALOs_1922 [Halobacteriovorax sp. BALOs_7]|nr:hypothetical protein BALOs_1922 [Halobacteriovorax sp. BALOs_7]
MYIQRFNVRLNVCPVGHDFEEAKISKCPSAKLKNMNVRIMPFIFTCPFFLGYKSSYLSSITAKLGLMIVGK